MPPRADAPPLEPLPPDASRNMPSIAFVTRLGDEILRSWRARDFDEGVFHEVAAAELRARRPSDHLSSDEIIAWVHEAPGLPPQGNLDSPFGSPPITLYRCDRFYIEALFWVDSTTAIHQHHFSGAFHVLEGSSLHSEYTFETERRCSDRLRLGRLRLAKVEHLRRGDVREIRSSDGLIHSLFHLERPSVSLVVRTEHNPFAGPQYSYQRSGVAWDPVYMTDSLKRQQQTLELLRRLGRADFVPRAQRTIGAADAFSAFTLLSWLGRTMRDEEYERLLDGLRLGDSDLLERMRRQREESARERAIVQRRERIHSARHRFFLALLLNVPSRTQILDLVREEYPDTSAVETILGWVSELAAERLEDGRNALDVELQESSRRILAHLLQGASDEQVLARLREEFRNADDRRDAVLQMCRAFRKSLLFQTLLVP